ncbi:MAG: helix-turn-helix domain-containing protein [Planctomycetota bacterium]|jgi:AcrR family transcriptional regulator|nr:helix-turn-helix domain-containing protein [Planctomycetota bacterium]
MAIQLRSQKSVQGILDAACRLFVEHSYADVSINQIASAAGLTKGAIYHHFSSKEDIYLEMLLSDLQSKKKLFCEAANVEGDAPHRLRLLTTAYFDLPERKRKLITLVRRDLHLFDGEKRQRLVKSYQEALPEIVEGILSDCISTRPHVDSGALDARLLSWDFVALVEVSLSPHAGRIFPAASARIDHVLKVFFSGISSFHSER